MGRARAMVCEVCGKPQADVKRYEVRGDGLKAATLLCPRHASPLVALLGTLGKPVRAGVPDGRRATMEEIEAMKRKEAVPL